MSENDAKQPDPLRLKFSKMLYQISSFAVNRKILSASIFFVRLLSHTCESTYGYLTVDPFIGYWDHKNKIEL